MTEFTRIFKGRKIEGRVIGLLTTPGEGFVTEAVDTLSLSFSGIDGDNHAGPTRHSGGREPWYPRGTEMRNERQLSLVSPADLSEIAGALDIESVRPEWIGANMVLDGIPRLSMLPRGTLLFFEGGVTLKVDGQNAPCRFAGAEILKNNPGKAGLDLLFAKVAKRYRGLVSWVEKPGPLTVGETVTAKIPEQWIYVPEEMAETEAKPIDRLVD